MQQIDLLSYVLTPEEAASPAPSVAVVDPPGISPNLRAWQEARLSYFTRLLTQLIDASIRDRQVALKNGTLDAFERRSVCRRWHIDKVAKLRQECAEAIDCGSRSTT